jgi:hypothetical protein
MAHIFLYLSLSTHARMRIDVVVVIIIIGIIKQAFQGFSLHTQKGNDNLALQYEFNSQQNVYDMPSDVVLCLFSLSPTRSS